MLSSETLLNYWQDGCLPEAGAQILADAVTELPRRVKIAARSLQIARRVEGLPKAWSDRAEQELAPQLAELRRRLVQVDRLGDVNNAPRILFAELGEEAEALNVEHFEENLLRSVRIGAGGRAHAARSFLEQLGADALAGTTADALQAAVEDLETQISRGECFQALLVGPADEGFVIGLHLAIEREPGIHTAENIDSKLNIAVQTALGEVLAGSGARYGMEWSLPFVGSSIGLPIALAALVAQGKLEPDPLTAASGQVLAGGAITGVAGLRAKLSAAEACGIRRVLLPAENREEAEGIECPELELRFVEHVSGLARAAAQPWTSVEVGVAAKKAIVRSLSRSAGFEVVEEKPIAHGYQFKLESLDAGGSLMIYDSGSVTVGASGAAKLALEAFADELLRDPKPETRETLTIRLPGQELQARAHETLTGMYADPQEPREHERWRVKLTRGKSSATAVLYNSGKLVLGGTAPAHDEIRAALAGVASHLGGSDVLTAAPAAQRVRERRKASSNEPWIGTDESGKGDYFGPLVSAAVYVDADVAERLEALGVQDSKRLSDARINALAPQLRALLGRSAKVTVIQPARYNTLYREMRAEGKNLNSLLAWGHYRSVVDLLQGGARPAYLIVDQFADAGYIEERLASEAKRHDIEILQFPKAEADQAVAAASILAREAFLGWLERESASLGLKLPKGAGPGVVDVARELVGRDGEQALGKLAKTSFKTTEKVLA